MTKLATDQPCRHPDPTVKAQRLAYLLFNRPDPELAERFMTDYGLQTVSRSNDEIFMRAADNSPFCYCIRRADHASFIGFGFEVASMTDLQTLSQLPDASGIETATYPGGGQIVRLKDPAGFQVEAIFGQKTVDRLQHREPLSFNFDESRTRVNDTQRSPIAPPEILRLGHVVLEVPDFQKTSAWYTQHFGLIPSDVYVLPDGSPAVVFFRLDLGDEPSDHHTLAMGQGFKPGYSHSAYELVDADAVGMGQRVMREGNWAHSWGIGRHIHGSQIFDYWLDPWGDKHEHYCDGDLFTSELPMGVYDANREAMYQWGQVMPRSFTKPKITVEVIKGLIHSLRHSPDVTLKKVTTLVKLFG